MNSSYERFDDYEGISEYGIKSELSWVDEDWQMWEAIFASEPSPDEIELMNRNADLLLADLKVQGVI